MKKSFWGGAVFFSGTVLPAASHAAQPQSAAAQLFDLSSEGDLAGQWLSFLFRSNAAATQQFEILSSLATALREGLNVYSLSMLTLAGFFLLWQIASMVAETAQTGVPLGKRTNQLWVPMRFLLGLALLIPLGSGLSVGQHMIVAIASKGSSLASDAWREGLDAMGSKMLAPIVPQSPDAMRVVSTSFEIEACRSMYRHLFSALRADVVVGMAGDIVDIQKVPAQRLRDETWRYSNAFFTDASLCGEYRFVDSDADGTVMNELAQASRVSAQRISLQNRSLSDRLAAGLLANEEPAPQSPELQAALAGFAKEQARFAEAKLAQIVAAHKNGASISPSFESQGWIAAGALPFEMARRQIVIGEIASRSLPKVKTPLAGHAVLSREEWIEAAIRALPLHVATTGYYDRYAAFYDRLSLGMKRSRLWLNAQQGGETAPMLPDQQDVTDLLGVFADADIAGSVFGRLVTQGAAVHGVFARPSSVAEGALQSSLPDSVLPDRSYLLQPIQTIAEIGRRFMSFGSWLGGIMGPAMAQPATLGATLLLMVVSALFWVAGAGLLFLVPLLPFFRFLAAVLSWGLAVLVAIVTLPLVALAHFYPAGDGLVGPLARKAYWLWLGLFMRPCLILFAFAGGCVLFLLGTAFLNTLFFDWASPSLLTQRDAIWVFHAGLALVYAALVYMIANVSFQGMATIPVAIMEWIGAQSILPESVTLAGGPTSGGGVFSMLTHGGSNVSTTASYAATSDEKGSAYRKGEKRADVAARQAQSAHFPHLPEEKAAQRAEARSEATAYARAETGDGKKSEAGAFAAASGSAEEAKAMAMSKHILQSQSETHNKPVTTPRNQQLEDFRKKDDGTQTSPEKKDGDNFSSREQSSAPVDDENNPFKRNDS